MLNLLFLRPGAGHGGAPTYLCGILMGEGGDRSLGGAGMPDFDEVNLPVISKTQKCAEGAEFWLKFPWKS